MFSIKLPRDDVCPTGKSFVLTLMKTRNMLIIISIYNNNHMHVTEQTTPSSMIIGYLDSFWDIKALKWPPFRKRHLSNVYHWKEILRILNNT